MTSFPKQKQKKQPGKEAKMKPLPQAEKIAYRPSGKLKGKVAIVTGGDSGIGKAVSLLFAKEGADIAIIYLTEHEDAKKTEKRIENTGSRCLLISADIRDEKICQKAIDRTIKEYGRLDILVNNAAVQYHQKDFRNITKEQLKKTFETNIFSMFYLTKEALKHMKKGASIINTTSVTAYRGSHHLIDYSATKGAIVSFTRSLSKSLAKDKIRVNAVAPGPVWTPLIPSSFPEDHIPEFGEKVPLGRPGQPVEIAPSYLFLATDDSSYMTGQVLHPNGGEVING